MLAASYFRDLAGVAAKAERQANLERDKAQRKEKTERWERYRSNIAAASAALRPHGLRVGQLNLLVAVARMGTARPADLCQLLWSHRR